MSTEFFTTRWNNLRCLSKVNSVGLQMVPLAVHVSPDRLLCFLMSAAEENSDLVLACMLPLVQFVPWLHAERRAAPSGAGTDWLAVQWL